MRRFFIGLVFTVLPLIGCMKNEAKAEGSQSGIEGTVTISPIRGGPVRQGAPTSQPLANMAFDVKRDGKTVMSFQTGANGQFQVMLPPGHYVIARQQATGVGSCGPFELDVSPGKMATVSWQCDSGLR